MLDLRSIATTRATFLGPCLVAFAFPWLLTGPLTGCGSESDANRPGSDGGDPRSETGTGTDGPGTGDPPGAGGCTEGRCPSRLHVGSFSACSVRPSGKVQCWGSAQSGALGTGVDFTPKPTPVVVLDVEGAEEIRGGQTHRCVRARGEVSCWGLGATGRNGEAWSPAKVAGVADAVGLAAGTNVSCAFLRDGEPLCWGGESTAATVFPPSGSNTQPRPLQGLSGVQALAFGSATSCAVLTGGTVSCWGTNRWSVSGAFAATPEPVQGLTDAVSVGVSSSNGFLCALHATGRVSCWGASSPALGREDFARRAAWDEPTPVAGLEDAVQLAVGFTSACAVRATGAVVCWGSGTLGSDTVEQTSPLPLAVTGIADAVEVQVAPQFACALHRTNAVSCWGIDFAGNLGNGTIDPPPEAGGSFVVRLPAPVVGLE